MINIENYGYMPEDDAPAFSDGVIVARITAVHRERFELVCEYGTMSGRLKTSEYCQGGEQYPTAGDFVLIDSLMPEENGCGECRIIRTLKRKSCFSRLDPSSAGHGEQAVAANFDYVLIMQSLNRDYNIRRLERYLTLAWQSGAQPVVILTKADLVDSADDAINEIRTFAVGVPIHAVSSKDGSGLEALGQYIRPRTTSVFLGSSGVGKSSLVNALAGEEIMGVNAIREDDSRGRHTTTHRQLIMLRSGAMIIDTPGMRELGMYDVTEGLGQSFGDVEKYFGLCRFTNCTHSGEPGCAIIRAIECGELSPERWESYKNLKKEALYSDDKASYMKKKKEWHKTIAIANKGFTKNKRGRD